MVNPRTILVNPDVKERLTRLKSGDETYNGVIDRLTKEHEIKLWEEENGILQSKQRL